MRRSHVVIAGGGFAALEAALALRALARDRVQLTLVSPSAAFVYRPMATIEAFSEGAPIRYGLRDIAGDLGAAYHRGGLEAVAPMQQWVRLDSGMRLDYDFLILATGARARNTISGALTFRDQRDLPRLRILLDQLAAGSLRRLAFAVPSRDSWSLPVYELALLSALRASRNEANTEIMIVTPEPVPLAVFGREASRLVAELLARRAIRFLGGSIPHSVGRDGTLTVQFDAPIETDRVVAVPELQGQRITGIPSSWSGFVPTDSIGRVEGLTRVYAAGDVTTYPIKQGGIAAQQADRIAHVIAAELGAPVKEPRQNLVLRARLLDGRGAVALRTELDALGCPTRATLEHRESRHAPDLKVFGPYLTPYLSIRRSRLHAAVWR